jgi:hypothetical protein
MLPFSLIVVGLIYSLLSYIPKSWIEDHIVKKIDPDDPNF